MEKESTTPARKSRAEILLLVDEGPEGPGMSNKDASKQVGTINPSSISQLIRRAIRMGPVKAAIGIRGEASKQAALSAERWGRNRKLSQDSEHEIAADYATGTYTQRELARKHGVSHSTIGDTIRRVGRDIS